MLTEITGARQFAGEPVRRWFTDDRHDLWVWLDAAGRPRGFQFCYGKGGIERALSWRPDTGFAHHRIEAGPADPTSLGAAQFMVRETWDVVELAGRFRRVAGTVPPDIAVFVEERLRMAGPGPRRRRVSAGRRRR
ncbi:MAG: hypothetical protein U1F52_08525 [Burkholderiales bacterium]